MGVMSVTSTPATYWADEARARQLKDDSQPWPTADLSAAQVYRVLLHLDGVVPMNLAELGVAQAAEPVVLCDPEGIRVAVLREQGGQLALEGLDRPPRPDFTALWRTPSKTREALAGHGWAEVAALPFNGPLHEADEAALTKLLEDTSRGLLLIVASAPLTRDDGRHFSRVKAALALAERLPPGQVLPVIVPFDGEGGAAVAAAYGADVLLAFSSVEVAEAEGAGLKTVLLPDNPERIALDALATPRTEQGFTVFFSGLSGSGKSTVANLVLTHLLEADSRAVTLLDGDLVRKNLSSELGFSREHRNLNIRRIGFVASLITKSGGIAVCAPIAPYDSVRKAVREEVEAYGGFILVHVSTPVEECERRDRKGLYAKARAGIIKEFTGISDPYETPVDAELSIDTTHISAEDAAQQVLDYLRAQGWIA